ncbi:predicted GPI-anchored protein 58 [Lytechinus variegatus]|uniref:predicted GPI-anchored protein 58 n=1 Tax=Lytechinus variegatus TaxID=7654 RepID=UPI001BB16AF1|nr:predicted GPI-anchored protein 58 [Lytechinus variegatus]
MPHKTPQGSSGKGLPAPGRKRHLSPTVSDSQFNLTPSDSADASSRSASSPRLSASQATPECLQHCGLLPPGSPASADGNTNRADQADTGHPTRRGTPSVSHEPPVLEPMQALPVNAQVRPPPEVRPREPYHGTHRHSSLSRAPASLGAPPGEETWVYSPSPEAEQAVSGDESNLDPPSSPAPQPSANTAQDAMEILHKYLPHIYPANEPSEGDTGSLFFPQQRKYVREGGCYGQLARLPGKKAGILWQGLYLHKG